MFDVIDSLESGSTAWGAAKVALLFLRFEPYLFQQRTVGSQPAYGHRRGRDHSVLSKATSQLRD